MGRIGRQRDRDRRRSERKTLSQSRNVEGEPAWEPPAKNLWDPDFPGYVYQPSETARITLRTGRVEKRLVDFAIILECRTEDGRWEPIYRIDCSGGTVHRHSWRKGMKYHEVIRPVTRQEDIEDEYDDCYSEVEDHWDEYEREWRHGSGK